MTITLQAVNELIASLESAGELSIREQKFLKLAKEFRICSASLDAAIKTGNVLADQNSQLAAENAALKDINAWCKTDAFKNMYREFKTAESLGCSDVDCMHDAMLVAIMHAPATPATDRIVAGIKADGAKAAGDYLKLEAQHMPVVERLMMQDAAEICYGTAARLREGADK
ncbi:TPA: hypothetical protein MA383_002333 [Klebsiella pneumoniae]|uniref:hypothetical protein n=1 Tax=Klebsiella pneumoniae TaxID=573 RepID=UPI00181A823C|nr:hypothetical protein [Klebsiella pneumoniae]MBT1614504.1 hypothetical protein [Klebsiella pneumoniae]MDR7642942.1 hypothetical protein [Klebsiella pneumoniae]NVM08289.1 hypothetical protein [Klebsiella pneumoniae]HBQ4917570.1 hypothetical protein [Klebsiella pneumoniae]HBT1970703.1 hypothetical protein [Klebsiella pneumoniae]